MLLSILVPPPVSTAVRGMLDELQREAGSAVRLWVRAEDSWVLAYPTLPTDAELPLQPGPGVVKIPGLPGREFWLEVPAADSADGQAVSRVVASAIGRLLRQDSEIRGLSNELAERYEEITLLYSISEILGSVISLEEAAETIMSEVISTLGARRAALWVFDSERAELNLAAAVGGAGQSGPIRMGDPASITADVFRSRRPVILDPMDVYPRGEYETGVTRRGYFLSAPVSYTPPQGETRMVGVINLVGRTSDEPYSAGDLKLISAIASQIGAAVENSRLVASSLRQERVVRELELAHDLQLKLLPSTEQFEGYAEVAARCLPAESVGGDFYHLFRLSRGRLGVMIGDVSSHGFSAALIMALTMSAVAIHASEGDPPADVLRRVHRAIIGELETTEMYLTLFYAVIDPLAGTITYTNAGHPHAFSVSAAGDVTRLGATNTPLGLVNLDTYEEATAPWSVGENLLFLYTDGLSDALGLGETAGEETLLREVLQHREVPAGELIERLFMLRGGNAEAPADDKTAVLVRI